MKLQIALIHLNNGAKAVLRGHPDPVSIVFFGSMQGAGGGKIVHEITREVADAQEEDAVWHDFIQGLTEPDVQRIAEEKYAIWKSMLEGFWKNNSEENRLAVVCILKQERNDVIAWLPSDD